MVFSLFVSDTFIHELIDNLILLRLPTKKLQDSIENYLEFPFWLVNYLEQEVYLNFIKKLGELVGFTYKFLFDYQDNFIW